MTAEVSDNEGKGGGCLANCQALAINSAQEPAGCPAGACRLSGQFASQIGWDLI